MKYDIVFEGGGAKGFGLVGALKALSDNHHTWDRLIGTSSGAIIATLLAAGYIPDRLEEIVHEKAPEQGLSAVGPTISTGAASSDALRNTTIKPTVLIGGIPAQVSFSGLSPQFVGVNQLNVPAIAISMREEFRLLSLRFHCPHPS